MINILVVDDEPLIRKSLIQMISENFADKELLCHEAFDGMNALEIVASINIDLLITDIKMPVCTGLELLERIDNMALKPLSIVLSGFDDYNLVRSAMKLGAYDYLLKPIIVEEFLPIMDNLFSEIESRQDLISINCEVKSQDIICLENQHKLSQLVNYTYQFNDIIRKNTPAILIMIELNNDELNHIDTYRNVFFEKSWDYFQDYIADETNLIQGEYLGYYSLLFLNVTEEDYTYIQPYLASQCKRNHKAGISSIFSLINIDSAIEETRVRISNFFYNLPKITPSEIEPYPYTKHFAVLDISAKSFNISEFTFSLHDLFLLMNQDRKPATDSKGLLNDFLFSLMQSDTRFIKIIGRYRMSENDIFICVNNASSLASLEEDFARIFSLYLKQNTEDKPNKYNYFETVRSYIEDNYYLDITLNDIAEYVNLHPNYFSSIFKKESGLTFLEYLRKVRIEKACQLMKDSNLHLYEIAEKVGYHDNLQFNRAFHKETGISPSEYRRG